MSVAFKLSSDGDAINNVVALDGDYLNRNTFGDYSLRNEIIGLFLAQLDGSKKLFGTTIDQTSWQFTAHTLKGAAAAVGARQIIVLAEEWERTPVPNNQAKRDYCLFQLENCIAAFKAAANRL
jgi:HPt (histidine-containing phosphotransfer) domain-containing protein